MAAYRIICTRKNDAWHPSAHSHIVQVGTGIAYNQYDTLWTVAQVYAAMDSGHTFYTKSESTGKIAAVHKWICGVCFSVETLRSSPDAVPDNNLDNLIKCN